MVPTSPTHKFSVNFPYFPYEFPGICVNYFMHLKNYVFHEELFDCQDHRANSYKVLSFQRNEILASVEIRERKDV